MTADTNLNPAVFRLKRVEQSADVNDPVTRQPMRVKLMSMLLPVEWQFSVSMPDTRIDCANNVGRLSVVASSPDGGTGILVLPMSAAIWSNNQAMLANATAFFGQWQAFRCTVEKPMNLAEALPFAARQIFQGAQIAGPVQPVPDLTENLPQVVAAANQQLQGRAQLQAEAGRLRVTGTLRGKQVEAWLLAMQTRRIEPAPGGGQLITTDIPLLALLFAPPGQLDSHDKLLRTVVASIQVDPQHTAAMQRHAISIWQTIANGYAQVSRIQQQMQADNLRAQQEQAAIRADAANYASRVRRDVMQHRAAALDHSSQQFALYMGDQALYRDPATGHNVQLSSGYNHVWASSTGNANEYILTDSAAFDPNGKVGGVAWTQMQAVR